MTKEKFLAVYRQMLLDTPGYLWAQDQARLDRFMLSVQTTLFTQANTWNLDSPVVAQAWRAIGCPGRPSYRGLRALASEGSEGPEVSA